MIMVLLINDHISGVHFTLDLLQFNEHLSAKIFSDLHFNTLKTLNDFLLYHQQPRK